MIPKIHKSLKVLELEEVEENLAKFFPTKVKGMDNECKSCRKKIKKIDIFVALVKTEHKGSKNITCSLLCQDCANVLSDTNLISVESYENFLKRYKAGQYEGIVA